MKQYILDDSFNKPFIVHGESGCGKTSVIAKLANEVRAKAFNFVLFKLQRWESSKNSRDFHVNLREITWKSRHKACARYIYCLA
jgi:hypothetical protein